MTDETTPQETDEVEEVRDDFWERISIPVNTEWRENNQPFVNPIVVADMFAEATSISAFYAEAAEGLTDTINQLEEARYNLAQEYGDIRRTIMADEYGKLPKQGSNAIVDAFVLAMASEGQKAQQLSLERELRKFDERIRKEKRRLQKVSHRLETLDRNMDKAREWLNYDKHNDRVLGKGQGRSL